MPNFLSGTLTPATPISVAVAATSTQVAAQNFNRAGLVCVNTSTSTMYFGIGTTAVLNAGIALNPNGGTWVMDEYTWSNGVINAIAHTANSQLSIQEFNNSN